MAKFPSRPLFQEELLRRPAVFMAAVLMLTLAAPAAGDQGAPGSFELVGHNPLMNRGMNAALAVWGDYVYVGSRTDATHPNAGVMVVDVSDPTAPEVVTQIPGKVGITTREMRIWPEQQLLIVLDLATNCSFIIHNCSPTQLTTPDTFLFYDIAGDKAASPELLAEYSPSGAPHEFFLWDDPRKPGRALLYFSSPGNGTAEMIVTDISKAREGQFDEIAQWSALIPEAGDNRLHSYSISTDGERAYLAYLQGGAFLADTSDLARGVPNPKVEFITPLPKRVSWEGPGAHSTIKVPSRPYMIVTDEVYGQIPGLLGDHGCPWGWMRVVDIKNPKAPKVVSEYKTAANEPEFCDSPIDNPPVRNSLSSHSAHNPTLTKNIALITWHSEGLQAVSLKNPLAPTQLAEFKPTPLPAVVTEDPVLSSGIDKIVMWSYPVIQDGLIYVTDVRNGLYILRYTGPFAAEITSTKFLEGNSNLGDALRFEKP